MRPIVVSGMGVVSPAGATVDDYWRANVEGRSAVRRDVGDHSAPLPTAPINARVPAAEVRRLCAAPEFRGWTWPEVLGGAACRQAVDDAGGAAALGPRLAVITTKATGPTPEELAASCRAWQRLAAAGPLEAGHAQRYYRDRHAARAQPPRARGAASLLRYAQQLVQQPIVPLVIENTCATATRSVAEGCRLVSLGLADQALVVLAYTRFNAYAYATYAQMSATSKWTGAPEEACKPFDRRRDGFVLGEGGAALLLESEDHAARRGATPRARVLGWGLHSGGQHPTAPTQRAIQTTLEAALAHAAVAPQQVDAINTHGTSTKLNDLHEARSLHAVFGKHVAALGISAAKSIAGHSFLSAGLVESVAAVMSLQHGVVAPVATCSEPDPDCDLPIARQAVARPLRVVIKNAFGFGGMYGALVFGKV